jgi:signal peptidase I
MDSKKINNKKDTSSKVKAKSKSKSKEFLDALLFAALVAFFLKIFFIEAYRIPTGSMENTLLVGDFLLVNKFIYGATTPRNIPFTDIRIPYFRLPVLKEPHKGDVVVFDFPGNRDEMQSKDVVNYIKRLVAEPGDTVQVINQSLFINGQAFPIPPNAIFNQPHPGGNLSNNNSDPRIFPRGSGWNEENYGPLRVPKKDDILKLSADNFEAWKMFIVREGHNPRLAADKKVFIDEKETSEYKVEKDYFFMMGDHRNNSLDSRFWGFMPRENVVGEALIIYWSWNPDIPFSRIGDLFGSIKWNRIANIIR